MFMNEECLNGDFKSVESLREANHRRVALPHVKQVSYIQHPQPEKFYFNKTYIFFWWFFTINLMTKCE